MGGCASKPKDLHTPGTTAPVDNPDIPKKHEAEAAPQPQESSNEGEVEKQEVETEVKKEEAPLVDLSEPAPEATKVEEVATIEAVPEGAKPSKAAQDSAETTQVKVEAVEEKKELTEEEKKEPTEEEKKEVAAEVAAEAPKLKEPEKEVDAAKPEENK